MGKVVEIFPGASKMQAPEVKKTQEKIQLNLERYIDLLRRLTKILETIPGKKKGGVYQRYRQMVKDWENEALIMEINNPDQSKLKTIPLFYCAVIDKARDRGLAPSKEN